MEVFKTIKRGETFAFYANITNEHGEPITGLASKMSSQIRNALDKLIAEFTISETETPGQYLFDAGPTNNWPTSELHIDIFFDEIKQYSPTFKIIVEKEVTRKDG